MNDPALSAHNIMRAAEAHGSEFLFNAEVVAIRSEDNRVLGVTLKDGTQIEGSVLVGKDSSGDIRFRKVEDDFTVERDSSGDIVADSVGGNFRVIRDGSGDIRAKRAAIFALLKIRPDSERLQDLAHPAMVDSPLAQQDGSVGRFLGQSVAEDIF